MKGATKDDVVIDLSRLLAAEASVPMSWPPILDALPVAVVVVDGAGAVVVVNRELERLTGYGRAELVGRPVEVLVPDDRAAAHLRHRRRYQRHPVARPMGTGLDIACRRKDGTTFAADVSLGPLPDGHVVCTVRDDSERQMREDALRRQALHDPLTDLANRTLLDDRLRLALRRAQRMGRLVGVLFLDLDHFKPVNDLLGHVAGDAVLRDVAVRLEAAVRPGDTVARFGGDEFVVLCEDLEGPAEAQMVAGRLLASVRAITDHGPAAAITASIGVAMGDGASAPDDLLAAADAAAYRAKAAGRDRLVMAEQSVAPRGRGSRADHLR